MSTPPRLLRPRFLTGPRVVGFVAALVVAGLLVLQIRSGEYDSLALWKGRLATVAAERNLLIENWVRERQMDSQVLATFPITRELVALDGQGAGVGSRTDLLRRHLEGFCRAYRYVDAALVGPQGGLIASCSGRAPSPSAVRWALGMKEGEPPHFETIDRGTEGFALRFSLPVEPERGSSRNAARDAGRGVVVLTTRSLVSLDEILPSRIGGTRTGRIALSTEPLEDDARVLRVSIPVLDATRYLVASITRDEALQAARAAALSQGLVATIAILLPLLLATIGWQRERSQALREALRQQDELLEMRTYAESIVQSIDAVVWEAEVAEDGPGADEDLARWRFSFVSKRAESLFGRPAEAWIGRPNLWVDCVVPEDRERVALSYVEVTSLRQQEGSVEFCAQRSDGSEVWLRDRVTAVSTDDQMRRLRGVLVDVTERVRAQRDTAALLAVARDVGGSLDRREILARVQRRTAEILPCEWVVTFLLDPDRSALYVAGHHGVQPDQVTMVEMIEFRSGQLLGRVLGGETVVLNRVQDQTWVPVSFYESLGVTAFLATPLFLGARPAGALVAFAVAPNRKPFEQRQAALLEGIARQLAVGLEVAQYHEEQADEAVVSTALARVGRELIASKPDPGDLLEQLCRLTVEVLDCDAAYTLLQRQGEDPLSLVASAGVSAEERAALSAVRLPTAVAASLLGELSTQGLVCLDFNREGDEVAERLRATFGVATLLCLPLRSAGGSLGIHCAGYRRAGVIAAHCLRIARGLAEIAFTVLERAQLVAELERANRIRSDFIATMSHELRTPLHIILGYQEMLLDDGAGALTPEQRDLLLRSHRSARTLLELVNATLDLTRIESRDQGPVGPPVDVRSVVDEVIGELADFSRKPEVSLRLEHGSGLQLLPVDPVKLKVILKNLVGNAIKFTDRGAVEVRTAAADQGIVITVSDTGIGIPREALGIIFEPFRQVDSSSTRRHGGVGLGLHIVQRLVGSLGGTLAVESEVGRGSTFRLWLPADAVRVGARAA